MIFHQFRMKRASGGKRTMKKFFLIKSLDMMEAQKRTQSTYLSLRCSKGLRLSQKNLSPLALKASCQCWVPLTLITTKNSETDRLLQWWQRDQCATIASSLTKSVLVPLWCLHPENHPRWKLPLQFFAKRCLANRQSWHQGHRRLPLILQKQSRPTLCLWMILSSQTQGTNLSWTATMGPARPRLSAARKSSWPARL